MFFSVLFCILGACGGGVVSAVAIDEETSSMCRSINVRISVHVTGGMGVIRKQFQTLELKE